MEENNKNLQASEDTDPQGIGLTSMDVLQQRFQVKFRGYDVQDVDSFLELVAKEMEKLIGDNARTEKEIHLLKQELHSYREKEKSINAALLTVQKISTDVKDNAHKEADLITSEAKVEAEKIVGAARQELAKLQEDINSMKQRKIQFEASFRSILETHLRLIEGSGDRTGD